LEPLIVKLISLAYEQLPLFTLEVACILKNYTSTKDEEQAQVIVEN
jgi:hypothetical protein